MYTVTNFHKQNFLDHIYDPHSLEFSRKRDRGFVPFIADIVEHVAQDTAFQGRNISLVELGIGGGGAHFVWDCHLRAKIYGVDLYAEKTEYTDEYKFYENADNQRRHRKNYVHAQSMLPKCTQVEFFYGMNAYTRETAEFIYNRHGHPLDIIIDDADPGGNGLRTLLPAWKPYIDHNGCIMSETIYGNGSPNLLEMTAEERLELLKVAHNQGFMCFDFEPLAYDQPETELILHHFVFWSPNFGFYRDVLDKYKDYVVEF